MGQGTDVPGKGVRVIQFLVCPQNDFIGRRSEAPEGWKFSTLHVGDEAVERLRGKGTEGSPDPFVEAVERLYDPGTWSNVRVVMDVDFHPERCPEFEVFGPHCVRGTWGAKLVSRLDRFLWDPRTQVIRANSLNVAADRERYCAVINWAKGDHYPEDVRVGVFGVWTHVKVEYLIFNLMTVPPYFRPDRIGVCAPLCASPNPRDHEAALDKFRRVLGVNVFESVEEYFSWLQGSRP